MRDPQSQWLDTFPDLDQDFQEHQMHCFWCYLADLLAEEFSAGYAPIEWADDHAIAWIGMGPIDRDSFCSDEFQLFLSRELL